MILKSLRLIFLRPIERFLTEWISVSTEPSAFVRERIRRGDTTSFLRAAGFFLSAITTAFFAEVTTLYLLGIGSLTEPYYWLVIVLTSIPFVLLCFLLVGLVASLSLKDVLHLSFYPLGAGVFAGAAFALAASAVVQLLVAVGYISDIKIDSTQWAEGEELFSAVLLQCVKEHSLIFTVLSAGFGEAYERLRPPIDNINYVRPLVTALYLVIAVRFFMAAVDRRKAVVGTMVLLAAFVATVANYQSFLALGHRAVKNSGCQENIAAAGIHRAGESALEDFARKIQASPEVAEAREIYDISIRAEGRTLRYTYRFKRPVDLVAFHRIVSETQKQRFEGRCAEATFLFSIRRWRPTRITVPKASALLASQ